MPASVVLALTDHESCADEPMHADPSLTISNNMHPLHMMCTSLWVVGYECDIQCTGNVKQNHAVLANPGHPTLDLSQPAAFLC